MSKKPRLAILGAGPVGLEAALLAARLEFPFTLYERGEPAEAVRQWGHVRLFSPFGMNCSPAGREVAGALGKLPADAALLTGREYREAYLDPLANSRWIKDGLRTGTAVVAVSRRGYLKDQGDPKRGQAPFVLLVEDAKGERVEEADVVLDCSGTYGRHRWLGEGGMPALGERKSAAHIRYGLDDVLGGDRALYAEKSVLLIGGGYSAATTVTTLAKLADEQPGTWVIWAARTSRSQPIRRTMNDPLRERDQLAVQANALATRRDANVEYHGQAVVERVHTDGPDKGFRVEARVGPRKVVWEVERVVANIGYRPDTALTRELQLRLCHASEGLPEREAEDGGSALATTEPGYFVLGAKSHGRGAEFLLRTGFEQVRECFEILTGTRGA